MADHVRVAPARLRGEVRVPGDKSISHRALILGALADGPVAVSGIVASGDVLATAAALRSLGASVELAGGGRDLEGSVAGPLAEPETVIDCANSGTAMRLLAGVAAGLDALTVLTGDASLRRRPMGRVVAPLRAMGAAVDGRGDGSLAPLAIRGGVLSGVHHRSPVASAQVKSAVLLAGLHADGETVVESPHPSRDHTERMLGHLGVDVERRTGDGEVVRVSRATPRGRAITVPGDVSSAAFWIAAAAVGDDGEAEVTIPAVGVNPTRCGLLDVLGELGADLEVSDEVERCGEPVATLRIRSAGLGRAVVAGARTVAAIDELPLLAVLGALSAGGIEVRDAGELRVKESDRIAAVGRMMGALGAKVEERPDGFAVPGGQRLRGGSVDAGGDHRIAMAAAVAGTYADAPVEVTGFDAVSTSYPGFLDDLARLGGDATSVER